MENNDQCCDRPLEKGVIHVGSLVSQKTGQPRVDIHWEEKKIQLSIAEARSVAIQILEASNAGETDAFVFAFMHKIIGADRDKAIQVLAEFRQWRQTQTLESLAADAN